jgi:hypothetical protein
MGMLPLCDRFSMHLLYLDDLFNFKDDAGLNGAWSWFEFPKVACLISDIKEHCIVGDASWEGEL